MAGKAVTGEDQNHPLSPPNYMSDLLSERETDLSTKGGAIHEAQGSLTEITPLKIDYFI